MYDYFTLVENKSKEIKNSIKDRLNKIIKKEIIENKIVLMPNCSFYNKKIIGITFKIQNRIMPFLLGKDAGCGISTFCLGKIDIDIKKFENYIKKIIPIGIHKHNKILLSKTDMQKMFIVINSKIKLFKGKYNKFYGRTLNDSCFKTIINKRNFSEFCKRFDTSFKSVISSMATLGESKNHFIELGKDEGDNYWLSIHTGSRVLGEQLNKIYTLKAVEYIKYKYAVSREMVLADKSKKECEKIRIIEALNEKENYIFDNSLLYLENDLLDNYLYDTCIVQIFALYNRYLIGQNIFKFFDKDFKYKKYIDNFHNYIDYEDFYLRVGANAAYKDDDVIIALNSNDGVVVGSGKSKSDWNYSVNSGLGNKIGLYEYLLKNKIYDIDKDILDSIYKEKCLLNKTKENFKERFYIKPIFTIKGV